MNTKTMATVLITAVAIFTVGCTLKQVVIEKNQSGKATIVKMKLVLGSTFNASDEIWTKAEFVFTRDFSGGKKPQAAVHSTFTVSNDAPALETGAALTINGKPYQVVFGSITGEPSASGDSTQKFATTLTISDEIEQALLSCNSASVTINYGTMYSTFTFSNSTLQKVKNFLHSTPELPINN